MSSPTILLDHHLTTKISNFGASISIPTTQNRLATTTLGTLQFGTLQGLHITQTTSLCCF